MDRYSRWMFVPSQLFSASSVGSGGSRRRMPTISLELEVILQTDHRRLLRFKLFLEIPARTRFRLERTWLLTIARQQHESGGRSPPYRWHIATQWFTEREHIPLDEYTPDDF